jgi:alpha-2-macroglobulin
MAATLSARHEGAGQPWLLLQTQAAVPLTEAVAAGYRLERRVEALRQQRAGQWSVGDLMRVRLTIEASQDLGWVVLSDALPPGGRVVGGGFGGESQLARAGEWRAGDAWPAFEERGDEHWRAVFEWLPQGRHTLAYTLRLDAAGVFGLPPTRVEALHAPENFAALPRAPLEVRP